jgi:hypothetical protein
MRRKLYSSDVSDRGGRPIIHVTLCITTYKDFHELYQINTYKFN